MVHVLQYTGLRGASDHKVWLQAQGGSFSSQSSRFGTFTSAESQISVNQIWQSPFLVSLQVSDVEKGVAEEVTLTTYLFLWEIIMLDIGEGAEKGQCSNNRKHPAQLYSHSKVFFGITTPKIAPKYKICTFSVLLQKHDSLLLHKDKCCKCQINCSFQ